MYCMQHQDIICSNNLKSPIISLQEQKQKGLYIFCNLRMGGITLCSSIVMHKVKCVTWSIYLRSRYMSKHFQKFESFIFNLQCSVCSTSQMRNFLICNNFLSYFSNKIPQTQFKWMNHFQNQVSGTVYKVNQCCNNLKIMISFQGIGKGHA